MSKDALVKAVKVIVGLARDGKSEEVYGGYAALFQSSDFAACKPEDQRQALKLMIHAKGQPSQPTPAMLQAYRSAVGPLTELVSVHGDPADHDLLGLCHMVLGNLDSADKIFRAGLALERERSPQSNLCGTLMKRIAAL